MPAGFGEVRVSLAVIALTLAVIVSFIILASFVIVPMVVMNNHQRNSVPGKMPEAQYVDDARRLVNEIKETLKASALDADQRNAVLDQVRNVPDNVLKAVQKLYRLRRLKKIAKRSEDATNSAEVLRDIKDMEHRIQEELRRTHETLLSVPVNLMKVDAARSSRNLDRIVSELSETNLRLNDLAASQEEVRAAGQSFRYP
jgi:large-conductance mechanosensitive channel